MFIKLTRFDNRPVWLNASFIVTVEPRRDGKGAVVVPIGDGLDYDVRETPEEVLRMLDGAPVPTVVPVPVSDCLTQTPADVSPEPEPKREPEPRRAPEPKPAVEATEEKVEEPSAEAKPKKRATRTRKTTKKAKAAAEEQPTADPEAKPSEAPAEAPAEKPAAPRAELELSEADVVRLRKLAPKSLAKLKNTLATQFRIADAGANVAALAEKGVITIDGNRVLWAAEPAEQA